MNMLEVTFVEVVLHVTWTSKASSYKRLDERPGLGSFPLSLFFGCDCMELSTRAAKLFFHNQCRQDLWLAANELSFVFFNILPMGRFVSCSCKGETNL